MSKGRIAISLHGVVGFAGSILFVAGVLAIAAVPDMKSEVRAAWIQAIGSIFAILSAVWIMDAQRRASKDAQRSDEAAFVLGFQQIAKEVSRMCVLSGFQDDDERNPILYPDISLEFSTLAALLTDLPIERLARHGQVARMLSIRRIALEMSSIWAQPSNRSGLVYRNNRAKFADLTDRARKESIAVAEYLKGYDAALYNSNQFEIERL